MTLGVAMVVFALAVASALVFSFLCSVSEAVLLSVGHAQVQSMGESKAGVLLRKFKREIDVPIAAILVLNTVAHTIGASVAGAKYPWDQSTLWVFGLVFTIAILVLTEIIPKTLGVAFNRRLAAPVTIFVYGLSLLFKPVLFLTRALSGLLRGSHASPVTSVQEIRLLAALGRTEGVLGQRFVDIVEGAARLKELTAKDVMVPRDGVQFLSSERNLDENLRTIKSTGHSRFPFTTAGDLDRIEGIVLVKDLMFHLRENDGEPDWNQLLLKQLVVPATAPLDELLRTFQEKRRHLAIVVDEYGGTQGILTLEDVLEEIVGEIEDETDRLDVSISKRVDGSIVCRGWTEMRKVLELLDIDEQVEVVSIGGFVAHLVGRVPVVGDKVEWHGIEMTVLAASPRRALRVEVRRADAA